MVLMAVSPCRSALEGLLRIARYEGPAVLWRGTDVSLMVAVPMVMLYFPLYETLLERCQQSAGSAAFTHSLVFLSFIETG
jgi:solute carrier family 25 protein 39/40